MSGNPTLSPLRRWNLSMVVGVVSCLFAERYFGHFVQVQQWLDWTTWLFGAGLFVGVLLQLRKNSQN